MVVDSSVPGRANHEEDWHVLRDNKRYGPFSLGDLIEAISLGSITKNDLVWRVGWSDWWLVGSVAGHLSPALVGMDYWEKPLPEVPKIRLSTLVHKFELKPRPTPCGESSRVSTILDSRRARQIYNIICIIVTLFIINGLSMLIFNNLHQGVLFIFAEFFILLSIYLRLTNNFKISINPISRLSTPLLVSSLILVIMNWHFIPDAFDAWQAKELITNITTSDQIQHVAAEYPSNKFIKLLSAFNNSTRQSTAKAGQLIGELEPQRTTIELLLNASTSDQLVERAAALRAAEARATVASGQVLRILDAEQSSFEQTARQIYVDDPLRLLPTAMDAMRRWREARRKHLDKELTALIYLYSTMGDLAEFMAQHFDQVQRPRFSKASLTFADNSVGERYTKLLNGARGAKAKVAEMEHENKSLDANQRKVWIEIASAR